MPSSHRETPLSGNKSTMAGERGAAAGILQPCDDQNLRCLVEYATAGTKNLSDEQIVQLLFSTFPHIYSRRNRKRLIERVAKIAKITPLSCRRERAVDEPTPKRQKIDESQNANRLKIDESQNANRQIEVRRASASASHSDSNGREVDSARTEKSGGDGRERDANGGNVAIIGDLGQGNELGDGKREVKKDENEKKWPMFKDLCEYNYRSGMMHDLKNEVIAPMHQLKLLRHFGVEPTTAILLHGPSGCGKTMLARAIGNEARVPFYETSAVSLKSGVSGILELFFRAYKNAPSIVFIDEIDALTSETKSLWQCPVKQLMACMKEPVDDGSNSERSNSGPGGYVLTIGATNKPDALDPALRRQFDREFSIDVPGKYTRYGILSVLTRNHKVEVGFDLWKLARWTHGFVTGDLVELVNKARMIALNRAINSRAYEKSFNDKCEAYRRPFSDEELEKLRLTMSDIEEANDTVWPSAEMEDFFTTPYTNWDDVGGLQLLKLEFERRLVKLIKFPIVYEALKEVGVKNLPTSFFLYGPSGCGKTLIVEALAKEAGTNFMHIKGTELLKFGNDSRMMVENIFKCAKTHPPCIVFFDELDIFFPDDDDDFTAIDGDESDGEWMSEEYRELRLQIVGINKESRVYVIASSSRLEIIDRIPLIKKVFGRILYAPHPTPEERGEILKALARYKPIDDEVDLMALGKDVACENFSGSDLFALVTQASKFAIDRPSLSCGGSMTIKNADFKAALAEVSPFLSSTEIKNWAAHAKTLDLVHGVSVMDW